MDAKDTRYQEIFKYCENYFFDHENPSLVIKNSRYYKEGYDAYGLSDEELRELKYLVLDNYQPSPLEIAELGSIFFGTGKFEFSSLAILLLKKHRPRLSREIYEIVKGWFEKGVENWTHADMLCFKITPVFLELELATVEDFLGWLDSSSKWARRAVPVTFIYLIDKVPAQELLEHVKPLLNDRDHAVQQGLGWFLKKLWQKNPREVEEYLQENKKKMPRTVVEEATRKMTRDKKKKFRKPHPPKPKNKR